MLHPLRLALLFGVLALATQAQSQQCPPAPVINGTLSVGYGTPPPGLTLNVFGVPLGTWWLGLGSGVISGCAIDCSITFGVQGGSYCPQYPIGYMSCWHDSNGCIQCDGFFDAVLYPCPTFEESPRPPDTGPAPNACKVGEPIDPATGSVYFDHSDAAVPGLGEGLSLTRSYNSANQGVSHGGPTLKYGAFGPGWNHRYEERLTTTLTNLPDILLLRQGDGVPVYYRQSSDGPPGDSTFYEQWLPVSADSSIERIASTNTSVLRFRRGGRHVFDASGRLITIVDPNENETTLAYDASGRLSTITDAGTRTLTLEYPVPPLPPGQSAHQPSRLLGPDGLLATYTYDNGVLASVRYPDSAADIGDGPDGGYDYVYAGSRLATVTDLTGRVLEHHEYYADGRAKTSQIGDGAELYTLTYLSGAVPKTEVTDARGNLTVYEMGYVGTRRQIVKVTGCAACGTPAAPQEWLYNSDARVIRYTNPAGLVTDYTYDPETGDLLSEAQPQGHTTSYTHYSDGRIHTKTAPNGSVTTWTYVAAGPATITETVAVGELDRVTTFTYTPEGKLDTLTDPRNKVTRFTYTSEGDLGTVTDPLGTATPAPTDHMTSFEYDALGRRTAIIDPLGNRSETTYNSVGKVLRSRQVDSHCPTNPPCLVDTLFEYDQGGRRNKVTDALGRITTYDFDPSGRLWHVYQPPVDGQTPTTTYAYDGMSNLTSITDAETHATAFAYDEFNRVKTVTYPGNRIESYTYDPVAGWLKTRVDRKGVTTTYGYDTFGRLTSKTFSDGTPPYAYRYDEGGDVGFLTGADQAGARKLSWDYDLAGQLRQERYWHSVGVVASRVEYTYDPAGNRASLKLGGQLFTTYGYDDASRLTSITRNTSVFTFGYDDAHRRTSMTYPNGVQTTYAYDDLSRLLSIDAVKGAGAITHAGYTYDDVGNRLSKTQLDYAESYEYDPLYRLTKAIRGASTTEQYSYDRVGNRLTSIDHSDWDYNERNELESYGGVTFTYDSNGNLASKVEDGHTWTYEWSAVDELKRVLKDAVEVARFAYDPLGRRAEKVAGGMTRSYVYDTEDIIKETAGATSVRYVHGPGIDEPLASENVAGQFTYEHGDGLGSELRQTDAAGAVTFSRSYDAFGQLQSGATGAGYAFTGREWDPETGLYYYRARYYDPELGRFNSQDPIRWMGGLNLYSYVGNRPAILTDPLGLQAVWYVPCKERCRRVFEECVNARRPDVGPQTFKLPQVVNAAVPEVIEVIVGAVVAWVTKDPKKGAAAGVAVGVGLNMCWPSEVSITLNGMAPEALEPFCRGQASTSPACTSCTP